MTFLRSNTCSAYTSTSICKRIRFTFSEIESVLAVLYEFQEHHAGRMVRKLAAAYPGMEEPFRAWGRFCEIV